MSKKSIVAWDRIYTISPLSPFQSHVMLHLPRFSPRPSLSSSRPYFEHFCAPKNFATLAAVALCIGNVGCSVFSHRYSLTAYWQLGSLVYHVGVPLSLVNILLAGSFNSKSLNRHAQGLILTSRTQHSTP
jgi:hypothetical protein